MVKKGKSDVKSGAKKESAESENMEVLRGEICPVCHQKTLTLMDSKKEIPYFGMCYIFSMDCSNESCKYHKADIETEVENEPSRYLLDINKEDDMKIRVIKSSTATIKIPHVGTIEPGPMSNGYITNVEGILNRIKKQTEDIRDNDEDEESRKKAKNIIKKITRIIWGQEKARLIIEDPAGNSAIISEKAIKEKYKPSSSKWIS
ncbi:MAG: ZPR1 zinc finger domain-containing protein [Candidatus Woesearchaeota archaeon]